VIAPGVSASDRFEAHRAVPLESLVEAAQLEVVDRVGVLRNPGASPAPVRSPVPARHSCTVDQAAAARWLAASISTPT
jgi:hypothetical protein